MSKPILEIDGVSKSFNVRSSSQPYLSIRDSITSVFTARKDSKKGEFWALNDVTFSVNSGESIGIVGRNGAGKSTLLKILSRITFPTKGEIICRGRIASLLEVGTGFHPELTGHENIFLNGSILGLTRQEIKDQYDAIVEFSGVEDFLNTPLKHFSSGMQLRLAFAVAAHLEPEILIIDEVLAVGDSAFQQKCIQKMTEVSQSGRTILFVSHNLHAIRTLCDRCILLDKGKIVASGDTEEVLRAYSDSDSGESQTYDLSQDISRQGAGALRFKELSFNQASFRNQEEIKFALRLDNPSMNKFRDLDLGISIRDMENLNLIHMSNKFIEKQYDHLDETYSITIQNNLSPGRYKVVLFLRCEEVIQDWIMDGVYFNVEAGDLSRYALNSKGILSPKYEIEQR